MPVKTLKIIGTFDYMCTLDDAYGTPEASVFTLRMLDSRVAGQIKDASMSIAPADGNRVDPRGTTIMNLAETAFKTCQFGIAGWRNVFDAEGNELKYETTKRVVGQTLYEVVDPTLLALLPLEVLDQIANAIRIGNVVTKEEVKNSSAS